MALKSVNTIAVALVLVFGGIGAWTVYQWLECRALGHTVLYCLKHIS